MFVLIMLIFVLALLCAVLFGVGIGGKVNWITALIGFFFVLMLALVGLGVAMFDGYVRNDCMSKLASPHGTVVLSESNGVYKILTSSDVVEYYTIGAVKVGK